ncbi:MAG: 50S ribosomal protein L23 [Thermoguttaceae bacterium]|nr:50S ribosomal protein L23 [Thermoguttaceae bacterium]MBQ9813808.1 50S ribosomal protein L23 [Thermoguttaceae bacterium]MBR4751881.1 50S ribosomal protein L23 [Thermoguttaceae bacterium]MBR5757411.1 50S ribosomal protein L23 [Thermoguttaceae bacterium]
MPTCKDVTDTNLVLEPYQVIIRPIVTEKAFHNSSARNTYTFEVHKLASKTDVKKAIEALYDVKVVAVTTQNRQGKKRRTRKGVGCTRSWKKAMVKLDGEHRLDLY